MLGLELRPLARADLPEGAAAEALAGPLRDALRHRRDQQHLLPSAEGSSRTGLGRRQSAPLPLRSEDEPVHHAHPPARRARARDPALLLAHRAPGALAEDGPGSLAAAADLQARR